MEGKCQNDEDEASNENRHIDDADALPTVKPYLTIPS
jgi:hypothetical protein